MGRAPGAIATSSATIEFVEEKRKSEKERRKSEKEKQKKMKAAGGLRASSKSPRIPGGRKSPVLKQVENITK